MTIDIRFGDLELLTDSKFLILVGIGNTIRMDDGAGIRVVEHLEHDPTLTSLDITFRYLNTGGFDILDEINGYTHAILMDAANIDGLPPGEIFHFPNVRSQTNDLPDGTGGMSSHGMGVLHVLKYADMAGYQVPHIIEIYGIQIKETEYFSEDMTPEVSAGVTKLVNLLRTKILDLFTTLD